VRFQKSNPFLQEFFLLAESLALRMSFGDHESCSREEGRAGEVGRAYRSVELKETRDREESGDVEGSECG